ncbi:hypothetical protein B9Z19DRAFT_1064146 [Tuber borchii]|uniref:Uncharacterized protein n=1 Tax=Tuber borchii TaxID=42251 RepID=A0A2T6ZVS4_TUBBO|nr:hypothetical protein B9Z19DRAFT_1064146 [Tuber borchii]
MNNNSNPSANMPTQTYYYIPKSPGSISELAKYYYNTQIRDSASSHHPSSRRYGRTYSDSALHEPIDILDHRVSKRVGEHDHDHDPVNQYVYKSAWEEGLEGSERKIHRMEGEERRSKEEEENGVALDIQHRIIKRKLRKLSPRDVEEWDELELIENEVWGDFSTPTPQAHQSGCRQGVTSKGRVEQGTLPTAKRAQAPIGIANYLLQGQ